MTDINEGLPPNDLRLFLRTISMATPEQVIRLGRESADHIDALEASNKALVEALERIDSDLESRNFLENSSLRDTTRTTLAAAKKTT